MADLIKLDMTNIWADTGDKVAPTDAKIRTGWVVEAVARQTWNWFENRQDQNIAYMLQKGIPEWDQTTQYIANKSFVQRNNIVYKAIQTTTNVDPATTPASWVIAFTTSTPYLEKIKNLPVTPGNVPFIDAGGNAVLNPIGGTGSSLLSTTNATDARTILAAQTQSLTLDTLSTVSPSINTLPYWTGTNTAANTPLTAAGRSLIAANSILSMLTLLGLEQVNNTSDLNKPVSNATQTVLNTKANNTISIVAQTGLVGGGNLQVDRGIALASASAPITAQLMNQSLDNYQTPGYYYQNADVNALLAYNYPVQLSGTLVVTTAAGIVQEYTTYGSARRKFIRTNYAGVWYAWTEVFTTLNLLNIGTTAASAQAALGLTYPATAGISGIGGAVVIQNSPVFTGTPTADTAAFGTNSAQLATTAFVQQNASANPAGTVITFAGTAIPTGYLLCNGAQLSRASYPQLFNAIGGIYGAPDGATFNIPDLRGLFIRSLDSGRGIDAGRVLGTYQASQMSYHGHTFVGDAYGGHSHGLSMGNAGSHTHAMTGWNAGGVQGGSVQPATSVVAGAANTITIPAAGDHVHTLSMAAAGAFTPTGGITAAGGTTNASETRPANIAMQFLIKY